MNALGLIGSLARLPATLTMNAVGLVPRPSFLTFAVTWRCNARCSFCGSWGKDPGDEMDLDAIARVLTDLGRLDCVRLTGGEPSIRDDLPAMVDLASRTCRPASIVLSTNGLLPARLERLVTSVRDPSRLHVHVSLDAPGNRHDELRGVPGAFDRAMESLTGLSRLRRRLGFGLATAQTVVDDRGARDYPALRDLADGMGIRHHVAIGHRETAMYSRPGPARVDPGRAGLCPFPALGQGVVADLVERAIGDAYGWSRGPERIARLAYLQGVASRVREGHDAPRHACVALRSHVRVMPDGGVPVCQFDTRIAGNLALEPLDRVWHRPATAALRRDVDACRGCWAECESGPSGIYAR